MKAHSRSPMDVSPPGLPVDELVPSVATVVDDVVEGFEDLVREPVVAHELPDVFPAGFSSGHFAGNGMSVMFGGTIRRPERCQPA